MGEKVQIDWRKARAGQGMALVALVACLYAGQLPAADGSGEAFSIGGFGTLGATRTTTDDVEFVRDLTQPRGAGKQWDSRVDSVFGLQANWKLTPGLEGVVQATSRYRFDGRYRPELAWAYLKYDPLPNVSLRAGRLGTEFFMLADSRWVGYSYLTVRPVGDYFWALPFYSIYGGDAALSVPVGEDIVRGKLFYGRSTGKVPLADEQWDIEGAPMLGAYLEYLSGPWHVRGSYANMTFKSDLPIAPVLKQAFGINLSAASADALSTRDKRTHYYSLGVVFDQGPWQAQLMLNRVRQGSLALESSDGGYALLGYRVGQFTPYLGYSWIHSHKKENPTVDPIVTYVMEDSHASQKTSFLGMRWDFARNLAFKAQWDAIRGDPSSLFPYREDKRQRWDGKMDVFSLTLDFVF